MIKTAICDSAKGDFLNGVHAPNDRYKLALYFEEAVLDAGTKEYTPNNEASGVGYLPGGKGLSTPIVKVEEGEASMSFASPIVWDNASIRARGAMIYNATKNKAIVVFDFGEDKVSTTGPFTVTIPEEGAIILS